jgi:hypothetical protein
MEVMKGIDEVIGGNRIGGPPGRSAAKGAMEQIPKR